jgi:multicomponent Na+:H+ antiporter subunit A
MILTGAFLAVTARTRLTAIAALGVVGYGVALVYLFFSAPDLAMTQFSIETLMVILFVLVLYRLPRFALLSSPKARGRDIFVALANGGLVTALVLFALSGEAQSPISRFFMEQSVTAAHGRNTVNVILVDFRALDTLGEITVLAAAALGVYALLREFPERRERR